MIFQCLGITGAILLFYGLIAFAVTQISSWFLYSLMGIGLTFILAFIIKALNRSWQKLVILFVSFNAIWILFYVIHDYWSKTALVGVCVGVTAIIAAATKRGVQKPQMFTAIATPLILTGIFVAFQEKPWADKIILVSFLLLNLVFFWVAKSFIAEMFQKRSMRYGTSAAIYSFIVGFILIVVNIGSQDFHRQFDFTADNVNTLSDQTIQILGKINEPMQITAFFESQTQEQASSKAAVKNILNNYHSTNKKIETMFIDPDKEKILADKKHAGDGDIVVEYKGKSHITKDGSEQGITEAILKVTKTESPLICFSSGFGEMGLDDPDDMPRSISILKASLENQGYESKKLELLSDKVPSNCSLVIVASPQQRIPQSEVNVFDQYLADGGKLILLLDPILPNLKIAQNFAIQSTGFDDMLKKWGIKIGNNLVLQKNLRVFQGEVIEPKIETMTYGNHPIVDSIKSKATVFNTVQSLQKEDDFAGTTYELIKSAGNNKSWAETNINLLLKQNHADFDAADIMGPITIAMVSEKETPKNSKLVVFGDGDFVSNALISTGGYNYDLFLNTINWLVGDSDRISIRPKKIRTSAIELSPEDSYTIFYLAIISLPMLVLIFGINLWWVRRRRG